MRTLKKKKGKKIPPSRGLHVLSLRQSHRARSIPFFSKNKHLVYKTKQRFEPNANVLAVPVQTS